MNSKNCKNIPTLTLIAFTTLLMNSCAHHAQIMGNEDGTMKSFIRANSRDQAEQITYDDAAEYCKKDGNRMVTVVKRDTKYTGAMDEETRNTIKKASTVASVLGGIGAVGDAGQAGRVMTSDNDYLSELIFKCK